MGKTKTKVLEGGKKTKHLGDNLDLAHGCKRHTANKSTTSHGLSHLLEARQWSDDAPIFFLFFFLLRVDATLLLDGGKKRKKKKGDQRGRRAEGNKVTM